MELHNLKILVVEDDKAMRKAMTETLSSEGFLVISAQDGVEGLETALRELPQLILLDISMPKLDGMAMMKRLRNSGDWGKKVPVILLTNLNADDKIMAGIAEDEPSYFLLKSEWSPVGVVQKIKETLGLIKPDSISV